MAVTEVPFTDLLSAIVDNRGRTAPTADAGTPLIATNCIKENGLYPVFDNVRYIDEETYDSWFRGHPSPGDIIFVCKGAPGRVSLAPDPVTFCIAQDMVAVRPDADRVYPRYLFAALRSKLVRNRVNDMHVGTMIPHFKKGDFHNLFIPLVDDGDQRKIGDLYFELSDKVESNRRTCQLLRELGQALVAGAGRSHNARLRDLTLSISRGVTPKYADEDPESPVVINQKCVRDGRVSLALARRMIAREVPQAKRVASGDVLVNSTGTGTLGRVGRWHAGEVFADSHVSIVKGDPTKIAPTLLAYLMFAREVDIEHMGTGSTGQTELSPTRLGDLVLDLPSDDAGTSLEPILLCFEARAAALEAEIATLAGLRDTLLPELLSGRIHVPEAAKAAEGLA